MSGLSVATGPTLEPVSLIEARAHCRIDSAELDGLLVGFLIGARQLIEKRTGRALLLQTLKLKIDHGWPCDRILRRRRIVLPQPPLFATAPITSITYVDTDGETQTLAADQYSFSAGDTFGVIEQAYGVSWPAVRCQSDAIEVTYKAGYGSAPGDVPEPLRLAIMLLVAHFLANPEAVVIGTSASELPLGVEALIQNYLTEGFC